MVENSVNINVGMSVSQKIRSFVELMKMRLSLLVAFSSAFGYTLAMGGRVDWLQLAALFVGGWLISGASCTVNQVLEKDYDKLMKRTQTRPLPTERLNNSESLWFALFTAIAGISLLWASTNLLTVGLSVLSMILYSFVYTPLKRVGPIAVFVGAFPGALPPLLGWTAATGTISHEALIIFGIQFVWQFPHFWAIAWVADEDYKKAGFKLLPVKGEKDMKTAFQIMTYTLFLIPLGLLPTYFGLTGINSAVIATVCGVLFLASTIKLMKDQSRKSALRIMFGSFLYLPIVQIAYLLDMVK
ncbi:MAG: protoheme IX farnesyltransferase [Roseivirga sp.]|jgi:protoheme IX farnesyltransferase|nr:MULTISPECIES: heme o synthase [Roseivirga]MBO6659243.1 protoheme IX farnesyltransferase [Roseivirga sp.]MBO6908020.1 protoheme IX farnesyltransferase [Roseivirga sp.]